MRATSAKVVGFLVQKSHCWWYFRVEKTAYPYRGELSAQSNPQGSEITPLITGFWGPPLCEFSNKTHKKLEGFLLKKIHRKTTECKCDDVILLHVSSIFCKQKNSWGWDGWNCLPKNKETSRKFFIMLDFWTRQGVRLNIRTSPHMTLLTGKRSQKSTYRTWHILGPLLKVKLLVGYM